MLRKVSPIIFAVLLCVPLLAHAEESTVLNLGEASEQQEWNVRKLTNVSSPPGGVRIKTSVQGTILRPLSVPHGIDVVEILYLSPYGGAFSLLWQGKEGGDSYYQVPLKLAPAAQPRKFTVALGAVGHWTTRPAAIGFSFPEGTDVTIQTVTLRGWNPMEKLAENVKCFWAFDVIAPHSINFLWGPLLCSSSVAREILYDSAPPIAHSGMRFIYEVLALGLVLLGFRVWRGKLSRKQCIRQTLILTFALWAVLDVRMGTELLRNWSIDIRTYVGEPAGKRIFRSLEFFPDFSAVVRPILEGQPKYVFLSYYPERYIRYFTWPGQPVAPASGSGALHWLVYDRKDLKINAEGRIVENGTPISPPGSVIHEFIEGTFIFRATQ